MAYTITTPRLGLQGIALTDTTQNHALGTIVNAVDPTYGEGEFIYLKGVASTVVGSVVDYDSYLATTALAPATGGVGQVAVAMSANVANQYGWYQISGNAVVKAPNAMTVGADVFMLAATPGSVDDAAVNGEQILNAKVAATTGTPSAGLAVVQISRPFHQGQVV
jgi:phospholipase/lecithinase/hemolysin